MRQDETQTIKFAKDICGNHESATAREWLVTNGIGGYASGTISGVLTRRYHGLLIAALKPPLDRKLLLTKLDEIVQYDGETFDLFANRWVSTTDPHGYRYIENFYLDGTIPVWSFAFADALLEKRIWMQQGANITYIRYQLQRGSYPVQLNLKALVNYRDHHGETKFGEPMKIELVEYGVKVLAHDGAVPFYLLSDKAQAEPRNEWYLDFSLAVEQYRGFRGFEDNFFAAEFHVTLQLGESVTMIGSTEQNVNLDPDLALQKQKNYESMVLAQANGRFDKSPASIRQLVLAADQFIVKCQASEKAEGHTIIAGYPWFGDWGRDTMISLPGLTITTGRTYIAQSILRTFARYVDRGMLPNRFPDLGETPESIRWMRPCGILKPFVPITPQRATMLYSKNYSRS